MAKKRVVLIVFCWLITIPVQVSAAQEITLTDLLPQTPLSRTIGRAEYLLESLKDRPDVKALFAEPESAKQFLFRWITSLHRSYVELPCGISERPNSIMSFSLPQLLRVYLILNALQNGDLISQIGKIIEGYEEGNYYEPGGLGYLKNGKLFMEQVPSKVVEKIAGIEAAYLIPENHLARNHVFTFHMHPLGASNRPAPGPSWQPDLADGREANIKFDLGAAIKRANDQGDYHHLLISKLGGRRFNLDYYVAEKQKRPPKPDPFQFCQHLVGFKIVDLGNWEY